VFLDEVSGSFFVGAGLQAIRFSIGERIACKQAPAVLLLAIG